MLRNNRVIFEDDTTLNDLSINLSNYLSGTQTIAVVAADDAIYLGSDLPFNHRYFAVSSVNAAASVISVAIWDGTLWNAAVDVVDQTAVSGKTLAQSGIISWVPDRNKGWACEATSEDIAALSTLKIYNLYWVRLTFSGNLTASTALKYIGHKFCEEADLYVEYPDLESSTLLAAFAAGKTTWDDQIFVASEYLIKDLREMNVIWSKNQILDWHLFKAACLHKTAEIIYGAFGDDYKDNKAEARKNYGASLKMKFYNTDQNHDAHLDRLEKTQTSQFLGR